MQAEKLQLQQMVRHLEEERNDDPSHDPSHDPSEGIAVTSLPAWTATNSNQTSMEKQMHNPVAIKQQYMQALRQIRAERDFLEEHRHELAAREQAGKDLASTSSEARHICFAGFAVFAVFTVFAVSLLHDLLLHVLLPHVLLLHVLLLHVLLVTVHIFHCSHFSLFTLSHTVYTVSHCLHCLTFVTVHFSNMLLPLTVQCWRKNKT